MGYETVGLLQLADDGIRGRAFLNGVRNHRAACGGEWDRVGAAVGQCTGLQTALCLFPWPSDYSQLFQIALMKTLPFARWLECSAVN
jgi:hypothetical protein